jgi:uncharacterized protein (TIGR03437 family)
MGQTTFTGPVISQNGFIDSSFTTAERDAIVDPQPGLLIYNTDTNTYEVCTVSGPQPTWDSAFGGGGGAGGFPYLLTQNTQYSALANPAGNPAASKLLFNASGTQVLSTVNAFGAVYILTTTLNTPYNLNDAQPTTAFTISASGNTSLGAYINGDGTKITVLEQSAGMVYATRVSLNTPYDLLSINTATAEMPVLIQLASMMEQLSVMSFEISSDGAKLIFTLQNQMSGSSTGVVRTVDLPVPYDVGSSTGTSSQSTDIAPFFTPAEGMFENPKAYGLAFDSTGATMFVSTSGTSGASPSAFMFEFRLGTAYDTSTIQTSYYQATRWVYGNMDTNGGFNNPNCGLTRANNNIYIGYIDYNIGGGAYDVTTLTALSVPNITSVSPSSGNAGTQVTITGTGFSGSTVTFGGVQATIISSSATQIVVASPSSTYNVAVDVVVTNPAGSSTEVAAFTNTSQGQTFTNGVDGSFPGTMGGMSASLSISGPSNRLIDATSGNAAAGKTATISWGYATQTLPVDSSSYMPGMSASLYFNSTLAYGGQVESITLI